MEATPVPPTSAATAPSPGELVLLTGRLAGTRKPLSVPLTSVGRQPGCDVRLDVEGVEDLHCVIVCGAQGLVVRDLHSEAGTFLNGERVQNRPLLDGDLLTVGPFQFQTCLNPAFLQADLLLHAAAAPAAVPPPQALLTQAAAVAAQQSALGEEEAKLLQRRLALEQQEQQLASHLEEKRQRLVQLTEQTQTARAALQAERATHQEQVGQARQRLQEAQTRAENARNLAEAERGRFRALRRRLKQRWQRHLDAERHNFRRREEALAEEARQLDHEGRQLQEAKDALARAQLQWNGEAELGRRQLQDTREQLRREQQLWQAGRKREQEELERRGAELDRWETDLADLERRLVMEAQQSQKLRLEREKEVEGLENRARNLRRKLGELEQALARDRQAFRDSKGDGRATAPAPRPERPTPTPSEEALCRQAALEALAAELGDQRLQLLEVWRTLDQTELAWQRERVALLAELEALGGRLQEREQDIRLREGVLKNQEGVLARQHDEAVQLRQQLESWQLRFRTRQANWEGERDRLLSEVQARESLAERHLAGLADLRERWLKRRRQEVQAIQAQRAQYDKLRQEAAALRKEWLNRTAVLEDRQRAVAEQELALEQHRQETLAQAPDAVAVERALEKHRRRWLNDNAAALRALAQQRQAAQAELAQLDERFRVLQRQAQALHAGTAEFSEQRALWDHEQMVTQSAQNSLRQDVQRLQKQREAYEVQLARLQDEVDRVAGTLLNEGSVPPEAAPPLAA
jgi:hypothetical protein